MNADELRRFRAAVKVDEATGCHEWQLFVSVHGYGQFKAHTPRRMSRRAHRVSYEHFKGAIPAGLMVLHKCDNRKCVNPDHLFLGTAFDNTQDRIAKGKKKTGSFGSAHGMAKLNEEQIRVIKELASQGRTQQLIADQFGVHQSAISKIVSRTHWRHV